MADGADYVRIPFSLPLRDLELERFIDPAPFVPSRQEDRRKRCEEIFTIQAMGLKKRLEHTGCKSAVIGISGGLIPRWRCLSPPAPFPCWACPRR